MPVKSNSKVHSDERHPNGTPKTIHHWTDDGVPVFHHEVVPMDLEDLVALGHSKTEAQRMIAEAEGNSKPAAAPAAKGGDK